MRTQVSHVACVAFSPEAWASYAVMPSCARLCPTVARSGQARRSFSYRTSILGMAWFFTSVRSFRHRSRSCQSNQSWAAAVPVAEAGIPHLLEAKTRSSAAICMRLAVNLELERRATDISIRAASKALAWQELAVSFRKDQKLKWARAADSKQRLQWRAGCQATKRHPTINSDDPTPASNNHRQRPQQPRRGQRRTHHIQDMFEKPSSQARYPLTKVIRKPCNLA